jgi:hypothetical protein
VNFVGDIKNGIDEDSELDNPRIPWLLWYDDLIIPLDYCGDDDANLPRAVWQPTSE